VLAEGVAQALPLADSAVDVVLSTLMLHHLPRKARPGIVREIKRVLKPGGRLLAVDFVKPAEGRKSFMDRFHRHGFVRIEDVIGELEAAGFIIARSGPVGERYLQFVIAVDGTAQTRVLAEHDHDHDEDAGHVHGARRGHGGGLMLAALGALGVLALIALHGGAALAFINLGAHPLGYAALAALALLIVAKLGFLALAHGFGARLMNRWLGVREE